MKTVADHDALHSLAARAGGQVNYGEPVAADRSIPALLRNSSERPDPVVEQLRITNDLLAKQIALLEKVHDCLKKRGY